MILVRTKYFLFFWILLLCAVCDGIYSQSIPFDHFSVQEGLSNSFVNCLIQDRTGFIWFGTDDGLNRFDGYEIKVFRNNPDNKSSISENIIWALFEDNEGYLWIGTKGSTLDRYNPYTDKFEHWYLDSTGTKDINITFVTQDNKSNLWIGTYRNGLYILDRSQNKIKQLVNTSEEKQTLSF